MLFIILIMSSIGINAVHENIEIQSKTCKTTSYDMVIIAPSIYSSALASLVEHKNNFGIITTLVTLDDIYDGTYFETQGRDNPEKIKYFIKDAIENWQISYVLFVGNTAQMPVRYCYNDDEYINSPEPYFVSELYYADIYDESLEFSTWDTNEDDIFGEWDGSVATDKPIDLKPDVCIGRLSCIDEEEVKTVVDKIINYESFKANPSWFNKIVVVGGDTYSEFEGYEGEIYNEAASKAIADFTSVKLWASTGALKNGWDIVKEINKGCGFWYLSGHGSDRTWVTNSPEGSSVGEFNSWHIFFLKNKNKLPICLVGGCHNSEFSVAAVKSFNVFNFFKWFKECWSWKLLSKSNGGSIATIGSTGLAWYSAEYDGYGTDWLNIHFFEEYANYNSEEPIFLGQICKEILTSYIENFPINWETPSGGAQSINAKTVQEWTLLGDPSLAIGGYPDQPVSRNI